MDTGLGKVRLKKSTIPGSTGYQVRWNAGPLTKLGGSGFCDLADKNTAIQFALAKAKDLQLVFVDETEQDIANRQSGQTTTCIEHGPGGTLRLSFQIKVF